jgi:hypothetical protein
MFRRFVRISILSGLMMCIIVQSDFSQGIAVRYPGDKNIHLDTSVIFTEMGEENDLNELFYRWTAHSSSNSIALDTMTFPSESPGKQSIRLFTTAGPLGNPGTHRTAMLYRLLSPEYKTPCLCGGMYGIMSIERSITPGYE